MDERIAVWKAQQQAALDAKMAEFDIGLKREAAKEDGEQSNVNHAGMTAMGEGLKAVAAAISKPKTLVRGPDGRTTGIT